MVDCLYLLNTNQQYWAGAAMAGNAAAVRAIHGRVETHVRYRDWPRRDDLLGRVGEVVRPYLVAPRRDCRCRHRRRRGLERTLDLLAILLVFGCALMWIPMRIPQFSPRSGACYSGGYVLGIMGVICLVLLLAFRHPGRHAQRRILSALTFLPPGTDTPAAERVLEAFSKGVECTRDARSMALLAGYTGARMDDPGGELWSAVARVPR